MTWDPTPWVVGGGAEHSPEVARLLAYASTGGAEGIVTPTDLRVQATATASNRVRVAPGAALIRNRFAGGNHQTYVARNQAEHTIAIDPTASGVTRTDLIIARIHDPQYAGQIPTNPNDFQYVRTEVVKGVPAGTTRAKDLNLNYPAIELAKVTLPASTATITNAMVTDLRRVAMPRSERHLFSIYGTGNKNTTGHVIPNSGSYSSWPIRPDQKPRIWIPEWATHIDIVGHFSGVYFHRGASTADTVAGIRTGFGAEGAQNGILIEDVDEEGGRKHYSVVGDHEIPLALRDSWQDVNLQGLRTAGSGSWWADYQTSIAVDIAVTERAV